MLTPLQAHALLVAKGQELGMPTSFKRDLEVHDLEILKRYPNQPHLWYLYPEGTHLWAREHFKNWGLDFFPDVAETLPGGHFFFFTGYRLHPLTLLQAVEIHAYEREASRRIPIMGAAKILAS